ncbi:PREDICTED: uncharacterized protein LOC107188474 [Dufourea novaeangliae]|uniref:Securin n=1 Tax=Dufourea novaeangliae TaxID=178035 RepID=A0A154PED8_DUFNO|nr:PREDICTED: uncharacterized protein LOC107188474 [Dufourea novaeangliae]KZC10236.1 hypothetical protein WN55_01352 [Dufourea novaeangliae]
MAGIFNLFGENVSNLNKGSVAKPISRSKTSLGIAGTSMKSINQPKPKGLSFRSKSDLNVPSLPHANQDTYKRQQECLKPKLTQVDTNGHPISPHKEFTLKKQSAQPNKMNDLSPMKILGKTSIKLQKPADELIFKKPLPPKTLIKNSYPEPETLAPYCDMQLEFDDYYAKTIENEFRELLTKIENNVQPYEDEGFESDSEPLELTLPKLCISPESDVEEWKDCLMLDLPEISDDVF